MWEAGVRGDAPQVIQCGCVLFTRSWLTADSWSKVEKVQLVCKTIKNVIVLCIMGIREGKPERIMTCEEVM